MNRIGLALVLALAGAGCVDVKTDGDEGVVGPTVEFDPSSSIIPFPNNLLIDPTTGKVSVPAQCNESPAATALREGVINTLDGFGTFKTAIRVTLSEPADPTTLAAGVKLYRRATGTTPVDPAQATPTPIVVVPGMTTRFVAGSDCAETETVSSLTIVAADTSTGSPIPIALAENSMYDVVITDDLKTATGEAFGATFTWAFVRQETNPVTVEGGVIVAERTPLDPTDPADQATLLGVDRLWKAHASALAFVTAAEGITREEVALAWEFKTQTATAPLDPTVDDSPAAAIDPSWLVEPFSVTGAETAEQYLIGRLGAPTCAAIGCASIGDVQGGILRLKNYQTPGANPLAGGDPIPGPWSDPLRPTEQAEGTGDVQVAIFFPATPMPETGWPTIVYGHGLGSSKESLAALAPGLARAGFASVAIDFVAHGSRAVQNTDNAAIGCGAITGPPTSSTQQCFAPIFSANLASTRDNVRQTALDLQGLISAVRACPVPTPPGEPECADLQVDATKVGYIGISLGGIIGSIASAESDGLVASVTNVAGAGLIDVIENTQTLSIKCSLVDALIDAGVVTGDKWNLGMNMTTAACLTDDWRAQPSYLTFANSARWVLDSADPANYAGKLATRVSLLQEVMGDRVVPNIATDQLGALSGRVPAAADPATSASPDPSVAISGSPTTSKWVRYENLAPAAPFPGNTFHHASLLQPAPSVTDPPGPDGNLGTARMQTDAVFFLFANIQD
jgi:hypothetical protein